MGFFDLFKSSKTPAKPKTIDDLNMEDLNREKIHWNNEVSRYERREEELAKLEAKLKSEYACADRESLKRSIARKISSIRAEQKGIGDKIQYCFNRLQVAENFINIKENADFYAKSGVNSVLNQLSIEVLEEMISSVSENGVLEREKLASLLRAQRDGMEMVSSSETDDSLKDLMAELDAETAGQKVDLGAKRVEKEIIAQADARSAQIDKELQSNDLE